MNPSDNLRRRDGDRPSSLIGRVAVAGIGFLFAGGFGWLLVYELQHPPVSSGRVYFFGSATCFGLVLMALMASADYVIEKLGAFVRAILPSLPWAKWRSNRESREVPVVKSDDDIV